MSLKSEVFVRRFTSIQINVESKYLSIPITEGIYWVKNCVLDFEIIFLLLSLYFLFIPFLMQ
jgi:hypothetical protein